MTAAVAVAPAQFRWRRNLHVIVRAEGPERIAMEWWRHRNEDDETDDEFARLHPPQVAPRRRFVDPEAPGGRGQGRLAANWRRNDRIVAVRLAVWGAAVAADRLSDH